MDGGDYYTVLRREFAAEEGSFLLQLRCDFVWDRAAFNRVTAAMFACCLTYDETHDRPTLLGPAYDYDHLPRWLVEGFWTMADFVVGHTSHPAWKSKIVADPGYYAQAYERLRELADWFFTGHCPALYPFRHFGPM